jgi:hypothetical protein
MAISRSRSRTALSVLSERAEIEVLIEAHRTAMYRAAENEEYQDAAAHQARIEELSDIAKTPLPGPDEDAAHAEP